MFQSNHNTPLSYQDVVSFVFEGYKGDMDRPVYVDAANPTRLYTVRTAKQTIQRLITGLRRAGFQKGDTVLINSAGDIDYSIAFLGIIAAGGIFTGANPSYTVEEFKNQLRKTRTKFIFTQQAYADKVTEASKQYGIDEGNVFIFNRSGIEKAADPSRSWETLLRHGETDWARFHGERMAQATVAAYVMSSGTTGMPKAGAITHANVIAEITLGYEAEPKDFQVRRLLCLPQFATAALYTNHICPIRRSEVAFVMSRFLVDEYINNCERFQITELSLVPPMVVSIIKSPLPTKEKLMSIKLAHAGAAPLGKELQAKFKALLPEKTPFTQIWGMTETSGLATSFFYPEHDDTGSIGRLISNTQVKLIDDEDNDISAFDVRGELCIRGPTVIRGYEMHGDEAFLDKDGFFATGDICYCDSKTKKWYIVDRKKDLIKVKGFQVAPPELESLLLSHPDIVDAAVIGLPRPELGTELPRAYVVRREGSVITEKEVQKFVADRVSAFKRLEGGVVFLESIIKAASGKILKNKLRAML